MEVLVQAQTYNTYGGSAIYSVVGDLLTIRLGDYGPAVSSIYLTAYLPSATRNPARTLEDLFDQFHGYLEKLPKVTFRRKLQRIEIGFLSQHFHAADNDGWRPSVEKAAVAAREVTDALKLLRKRIKKEDDFDVDQFLTEATDILNRGVGSQEELEAIQEQAQQQRKALYASKDPWEQLEIDWSQYHPKARKILDEPFFWECANDFAPNGNDTGADLLEDFRRWNKRNANKSPTLFLDRLLADWDIGAIDWHITDASIVRKLEREQPIPLSICNEVAIALAFAVIKFRGTCPPEIVQPALHALERMLISVNDSRLSDQLKAEWDVAVNRMRTKLESLPH